MKIAIHRFALCASILLLSIAAAEAVEVASPNGQLVVTFAIADFPDAKGCPVYSIRHAGQTIVEPSRLGFDIEDGPLGQGLELVEFTTRASDRTWKPVYGERSTVRNRYHGAVARLQETGAGHRTLVVTFRVYDEGVAFCYTLPEQSAMESVRIVRENSEFRFPADHPAWAVYSAQGKYEKVTLSQIKNGCERPLTIQSAGDCYIAIGEARLVDYARMKLTPLAGQSHSLVSSLSSEVEARLPLVTPWRVLMVADSPGKLLQQNDILLNLNARCAIEDTSWIKPGKVIREVTLTTTGGKACIDFAAAHNLQYVEFDAGWYGHEYSDQSDARAVNVDPKRSPGPLDLADIVRYAADRDIGILLYVNRRALERQLDEILPLYQQWGIKGVKYGFVNVGSQQWTRWLHDAVRKAAEHRLMVDIHDEYRPTGFSRTYPNLMTQEGIGGDETSPTNEQTLTILFTRMLAGAADNTICYYDGRVDRNATHAYQLAKAVCFYSPWQFLYWYDRPGKSPSKKGGAGGAQTGIGDEPELEFFDQVPTVWDDTRVVHGAIGQYAAIARRSGRAWFIGCMNSGNPRTLSIPLDFLEPGQEYEVYIYRDDPTVATRTHVAVERRTVDSQTVLEATMSAQGGQAIRIVPAD